MFSIVYIKLAYLDSFIKFFPMTVLKKELMLKLIQ